MNPDNVGILAFNLLQLVFVGLLGYACGRGVRKELHREIANLRTELKEREILMAARAKREDKVIRDCLERLGASTEVDGEPNVRLDRSLPTVARMMEERRQQERHEQDRQEWEQQFEARREEALDDALVETG